MSRKGRKGGGMCCKEGLFLLDLKSTRELRVMDITLQRRRRQFSG